MNQWNEGQHQAIGIRDKRVLVSAAAGTGKTAVLVERVIRRTLDDQQPLEMDQFLLVTFTNAAAQEMRERISKALALRLEAAPEDLRIQKQQLLLGKAAISTLHAFCLDLVRQNYTVLGVDPQSRILNEVEQTLLKQEVMDELLEQQYQEGAGNFNDLVRRFGGEKDDEPLRNLILQIDNFAVCQPDRDAWLDRAAVLFEDQRSARESGKEATLPFLPILLQQSQKQVRQAYQALEQAEVLAAQYQALKGYGSLLQAERLQLEDLIHEQGWERFQSDLTSDRIIFGRMPGIATKQGNQEAAGEYARRLQAQSRIKALRTAAKDQVKTLQDNLAGCTYAQMACELADTAPAMGALAALVKQFRSGYDQAKREKAAMDFNDIEHWALKLLQHEDQSATEIAMALNQRFAEILVDEYQDINPMQEALLQALSQTGCYYMVGDIKQSIYGFRQAEPNLFLNKYRSFKESAGGSLVRLEENYRSCQRLIQGINALFDVIMKPALGGIDYQAEGRLRSGLPPACEDGGLTGENTMELHILEKPCRSDAAHGESDSESNEVKDTAGAEEEEQASLDTLEAEARVAGQRILSFVDRPIWDSKVQKVRPARFRDMVVLLPAVKGVAPVFAETFNKLGIPVYADMGTGYFGAQEIQTVVSFLRVLDNPRQDIPLGALMLSPAIGFSPEEMARIRLTDRKGSLYESLVRTAWKGTESLRKPLRAFLKALKSYRRQSLQDSMENVIRGFYRNTGFLEIAGAMPGGPQRQANLNAMVQRARQFEESNMKGLYQFLNFLEGLEKSGADLNPAAILSEADNVVRMMTIHKSKGLEFPIVLLCTAGRKFNMQNQNQDILIHRQWGLAPVMVDPEMRIQYPTGFYRTVQALLRHEALAEELRLLYVAMTRARERLVIIGSLSKASEIIETWQQEGPGEMDEAENFLDWIASVAAHCLAKEKDPIWKVTLWTQEKLLGLKGNEKTLSPLWEILLSLPLTETEAQEWSPVGRRLEWQYPFPIDCRLPGKISVTQAKGRLFPEKDPESAEPWTQTQAGLPEALLEPPVLPRFMAEAGKATLTGAARGTLLHKVMAQLDLPQWQTQIQQGLDLQEWQQILETFLDGLVHRKVIGPEERSHIAWEPLAVFLMSPLAKRMAAPDCRLRREAAFTMLLPAARLYPEFLPEMDAVDAAGASDQEIMIQGTLDAFFSEDDQWVLVDYKTDQIKSSEASELIRRYSSQMLLYAEALRTQTGLPVKEKWLYSLTLGEALLVP